jgi:hypothetical protein
MTPYELQQLEPFPGLSIPFGCKVQFKPSLISKDQLLKLQGETIPGIFVGYVLDPGGRCSREY